MCNKEDIIKREEVVRMIDNLYKRAMEMVPEEGEFETVSEQFDIKETTFPLSRVWMTVEHPPTFLDGWEKERAVQLNVLYRNQGYQGESILAFGTKQEALEKMKAPGFVDRVIQKIHDLEDFD